MLRTDPAEQRETRPPRVRSSVEWGGGLGRRPGEDPAHLGNTRSRERDVGSEGSVHLSLHALCTFPSIGEKRSQAASVGAPVTLINLLASAPTLARCGEAARFLPPPRVAGGGSRAAHGTGHLWAWGAFNERNHGGRNKAYWLFTAFLGYGLLGDRKRSHLLSTCPLALSPEAQRRKRLCAGPCR